METLILGIIVYVGWAIIKNFVKEGTAPGSSARQQGTPPIAKGLPKADVYRDHNPMGKDSWNVLRDPYAQENEKIYDKPTHIEQLKNQPNKKPATAPAPINKRPVASQKSTQDTQKSAYDALVFDKRSLVNGIIMREVLGPPKSKRK